MKPTETIPPLDWRQGNAIVSTISSKFTKKDRKFYCQVSKRAEKKGYGVD
jgi:hypothetical protein